MERRYELFSRNGSPTVFSAALNLNSPLYPAKPLIIGDRNRDGLADLLIYTQLVNRFLIINVVGQVLNTIDLPGTTYIESVIPTSDLTGDGIKDFIVYLFDYTDNKFKLRLYKN